MSTSLPSNVLFHVPGSAWPSPVPTSALIFLVFAAIPTGRSGTCTVHATGTGRGERNGHLFTVRPTMPSPLLHTCCRLQRCATCRTDTSFNCRLRICRHRPLSGALIPTPSCRDPFPPPFLPIRPRRSSALKARVQTIRPRPRPRPRPRQLVLACARLGVQKGRALQWNAR